MNSGNFFYSETNIEPEMKGILDALNTFGCLTKEQALIFMPQTPYDRETKFKKIVNSMKMTRKAVENGNCLLAQGVSFPDYEMIDCVWTTLAIYEKLSNEKTTPGEILENAYSSEGSEKINFILNKSKIVHVVPISLDSQVTNALFLQDKFLERNNLADGKEPRDLYFFVLRNNEILKQLTEENLKMPYGIAFLTGEVSQKPDVQLFIKNKK